MNFALGRPFFRGYVKLQVGKRHLFSAIYRGYFTPFISGFIYVRPIQTGYMSPHLEQVKVIFYGKSPYWTIIDERGLREIVWVCFCLAML